MKNWQKACLWIVLMQGLFFCFRQEKQEDVQAAAETWGSFTFAPAVSSDGLYRAEHSAVRDEGMDVSMIRVDVYRTEGNQWVDAFYPARAADFWGVCWEAGTHNLWIQSADTGICCYEQTEFGWRRNERAEQPASIVSKWDE